MAGAGTGTAGATLSCFSSGGSSTAFECSSTLCVLCSLLQPGRLCQPLRPLNQQPIRKRSLESEEESY
jgi:hypothetical protein